MTSLLTQLHNTLFTVDNRECCQHQRNDIVKVDVLSWYSDVHEIVQVCYVQVLYTFQTKTDNSRLGSKMFVIHLICNSMNIFHIIYLYQRLKDDPSFTIFPRTFVFGAKAAPSYDYAKKIIELILAVADIIDRDPHVSKFIKVLFVENYGVSSAEKIIPASDISEQISTAGKEASGTGNMKFMMNGAITLGTLDGANVEIADFVGLDNCVIFGLKAEDVEGHYERGDYNPWDIYNSDERIKKVIDSLFNGPWTFGKDEKYQLIFDEIMHRNDTYFILKDFAAYAEAQEKIERLYLDRRSWARSQIINIANSGFFTSDRTIEQYVRDIWHLRKLKI